MECFVGLTLSKGTRLVEEVSGFLAIERPLQPDWPRMTLTGMTPGLRAVIEQIQKKGVPAPELMAQVLRTDGFIGLGRLNQYLKKLDQYSLIERQLIVDGVISASIRPLSADFSYTENKIDSNQRFALSRFAYLRKHRNGMILECPLGHAEVACQSGHVMQVVHALSTAVSAREISQNQTDLTQEAITILLNFLANAHALVAVSADSPEASDPETHDAVLAPWEFHDLLFHTRCRLGRHDHPYGGTFPFKGKLAPLPVTKKEASDRAISLYKPEIEALKKHDRPFTDVLESRRSLRNYDDAPLTVNQLGEFLYRSARIQNVSEDGTVSFRPSPGGGALHELEIYPVVDLCKGLEPGLYHYNPLNHELYKVADQNPYVQLLVRVAQITAQAEKPPQVLLIIAARFQRMQHKYQSVTYSVILKNVGALYQTMYLVGTAMGLAPCGLGGGHADLFTKAAGTDYLEETSVGEFILGSRAATPFKLARKADDHVL